MRPQRKIQIKIAVLLLLVTCVIGYTIAISWKNPKEHIVLGVNAVILVLFMAWTLRSVFIQRQTEADDEETFARVLSEEDRRIAAIHEAGHTLIAVYSKDLDPICEVTLRHSWSGSRLAGGSLKLNSDNTRGLRPRKALIQKMAMMLGGRLAEEQAGGADEVTDGALNDLEEVSVLAQRMVFELGFRSQSGKKIGYRSYAHEDLYMSEEKSEELSREVDGIIEEARVLAAGVLRAHKNELDMIASELLRRETLSKEELDALLPISADQRSAKKS